jgi:membrane-associated protease RseP (regulator of RpoE activity)
MIWLLTIYLVAYASVVLHELGHATAGVISKRPIASFNIGKGPGLRFTISKTKVYLGLVPDGGNVTYYRSVDWRKTILILAAGPSINAAIFFVATLMLITDTSSRLLWIIVCINILATVVNFSSAIKGSDGWNIKQTMARRDAREKDYQDYLARNP